MKQFINDNKNFCIGLVTCFIYGAIMGKIADNADKNAKRVVELEHVIEKHKIEI